MKKYFVSFVAENTEDVLLCTTQSAKQATKVARENAAKYKNIFIFWQRQSDGQRGYLNRDGYSLSGESWGTK